MKMKTSGRRRRVIYMGKKKKKKERMFGALIKMKRRSSEKDHNSVMMHQKGKESATGSKRRVEPRGGDLLKLAQFEERVRVCSGGTERQN